MGMAQIKEGIALPINPPAIPGLGTTGGFEFWIQSRGTGTYAQLEEVTRAFIAKAQQQPVLAGLAATIQGSNRQMRVDVDRERPKVWESPSPRCTRPCKPCSAPSMSASSTNSAVSGR
ncbi:MAG: hypothetical protein R2864_01405 [Syntrophotaleaceae bacterium]